jgi:hypothetical protein
MFAPKTAKPSTPSATKSADSPVGAAERDRELKLRNSGHVGRAIAPRGFGAHPLPRPHGALGNQALLRTLSRTRAIQTKLKINPPGDQYEREADRAADQVMRMPERREIPAASVSLSSLHVQRKCACGGGSGADGPCEECSSKAEPLIQPKLKVNQAGDVYEQEADQVARLVAPSEGRPHGPIDEGLLARGGAPLMPQVREFYESRFGYDFSAVRLHTGPAAEDLNRRLEAHAFTFGEHIWLGERQGPERSYVMAHELAHVIQQRQPARLKPRSVGPIRVGIPLHSGEARPAIQRLYFFAPLNTHSGKIETGTDIHNEILSDFTWHAHQTGISIEAPVPNAVRNDYGIGYQGEADLYKSSNQKTVGVYFARARGIEVGQKDEPTPVPDHVLNPKAHRAARGRVNAPRMSAKSVEEIDEAPKEIWLNEMKPADAEMLQTGADQLEFYRHGFEAAREWTNRWAKEHHRSERWPSLTVNTEQTFGNSSSREGLNLALLDVRQESRNSRKKFRIERIIAPVGRDPVEILGDIHVEPYKAHGGLWMYYARPTYIRPLPSEEQIRQALQTALLVQDQVIGGLTRAPHDEVAKLALGSPAIQRKDTSKPPKLKDDFEFGPWNRQRAALHSVIEEDRIPEIKVDKRTNQSTLVGSKPGGKSFSFLKLLELAGQAEAGVEKAGGGKAALPAIPDVKNLLTAANKDDSGKPLPLKPKPAEAYTWADRWTSEEVAGLGEFRRLFGRTFVWIANLVAGHERIGKQGVFGWIKDKLTGLFQSAAKGGSVFARLAIRGVAKAIERLSDILLPTLIRMITGSIKKRIVEQLSEIFDFDVIAEAKDKFEEFKDWVRDLGGLKDKFEGIFEFLAKVVNTIEAVKQFVEEVVHYASEAEKWVMRGIHTLQCWETLCVSNLIGWIFESWEEKAIEKLGEQALKLCNVRRLIETGVHAVFGRLLPDLAKGILGVLHDITPGGLGRLRQIFEYKDTVSEPLPKPEEIVDDDCVMIDVGFGLFGLTRRSKPGKGTPGKGAGAQDVLDLLKFDDAVGPEKTDAAEKLMQKMGVPKDAPMSEQDIEQLEGGLEKATPKELNDLAEGKAGADTARKLKPLTDALQHMGQEAKQRQKQVTPQPQPGQPPAPPPPVTQRPAPQHPVPPPSVTQPPAPQHPAPPPSGTHPPTQQRPTPPPSTTRPPAPQHPAPAAPAPGGEGPWNTKRLLIMLQEAGSGFDKQFYRESLEDHIRMSDERPKHLFHLSCMGSARVSVIFVVFNRPDPFTPPTLVVSFKVGGKEFGPYTDRNPRHISTFLVADFGPSVHVDPDILRHVFEIGGKDKDLLEVKITLFDPDTSTTLNYVDHAEVVVDPCA